MLTWLLISLHHILHKNWRMMPQSTIMSITDRPASCTLHNITPLNATTSITSKIKYWDCELVYCIPQNVHQVSTRHQTDLMNTRFLCNVKSYFPATLSGNKIPLPKIYKYTNFPHWENQADHWGLSSSTCSSHTNHMSSNIKILVVHKMWHLSSAVCVLDGTGHIITPFSQLNW
jgi:hypothetical protein